MSLDWMAELAGQCADALVSRMTLRDWPQTHDEVARLFAAHAPQGAQLVEDQLRRDALRLVYAAELEQSLLRQGIQPTWRDHLLRLLVDSPQAKGELQALLGRLGRGASEADRVMINVATGANNRLFAVQNGQMIVHEAATSVQPREGEPT